jgi:hypothetical protein
MFSNTKRFIVAALLALTPFLSSSAQAQTYVQRNADAEQLDAWSRYCQMKQTVNLMYEQVKRERLKTRELVDDYERQVRENTLSPEAERRLANIAALHRSLDPPVYEIYSGHALNVLLEDLKPFQVSTGRRSPVPLAEEMLGHINVISIQDRSGNMGVLKNRGRLSWPLVLRAAEYQEPREALTALVPLAIEQALHGGVQPETLRDMEGALGKLNGLLADNIKKLPPPRYIQSKRYLGELEEALKLLVKPDAGNYFTGKFSARGKTLGELIQYMSNQGLRFAPALAGDEAAYENLHHYLAVYDVAAHQSQFSSKVSDKSTASAVGGSR